MARIRSILVAIKDPRAKKATPAVQKAARLARALQARVELFHAMTEPVAVEQVAAMKLPLKRYLAEARERCLQQLERHAAPLRSDGLRVSVEASWDFPAVEAVVRRVEAARADLLVVERHPTPHRAPWLLSYPDWELVRLSPVPLLLVKSAAAWPATPTILAAVDPTHRNAKPAVLDVAILGLGGELADALDARLSAIHARSSKAEGLVMARGESAEDFRLRTGVRAQADAKRVLDRVIGKRPIAGEDRLVIDATPEDAIIDAVRWQRSSVVIMGAISRSGLGRLFVGNTAERVLDALPCDVLIVKPPQFKHGVPRRMRGPYLTSLSFTV